MTDNPDPAVRWLQDGAVPDRGEDTGHLEILPQSRLSRRGFLLGAGALGGAALVGSLLLTRPWDDAGTPAPAATTASTSGGPLVLITLYGGNDGLNTVVPYADPAYHAARPTLGYTPEQILPLDADVGLNPKLSGLRSLWQSRQLAILRGVGYPNPNLSHFASMDIWQTANPTDGTGPGWLGRWLDATGSDPMRAISIGSTLPPLLRGERESATAITAATVVLPGSPDFDAAFAALQAPGPDRGGLAGVIAAAGTDLLAVKGQLDTLDSHGGTSGGPAATGAVASSSLAGQLGIVASLINAGAHTSVYQVSLSSFDTHADEKANQERLLGELDGALTGFLRSVAASPAGRKAVVMTFSDLAAGRPRMPAVEPIMVPPLRCSSPATRSKGASFMESSRP